jgi:flagellin-specific chaperone FliS
VEGFLVTFEEEEEIDISFLSNIMEDNTLHLELLKTLTQMTSILNSMKEHVNDYSYDEISKNIGKFYSLFSEFIHKLKKY